jgi:hypothetical protein
VSRVDPVHVYGLARLRKEYLERHADGGDFKAFLDRFVNLREAVQGRHKPVRFYGLTFGHPAQAREALGHNHVHRAHRQRGVLGELDTLSARSASLPKDEAGQLDLLHRAGLATDATTLKDALQEIELPFMFAGREQFVENQQRGAAGIDPKLRNVTMESPVHEQNALNLLLGRAQDAVAKGKSLAADFAYWQTLVPDWAPKVRDQLEAQGIPFSVELLASPGINLTDPSKPLFDRGAHPASLSQLGVDQGGEQAFLRSLSAEELMTQIWPLYYQYYHRPAGAPVPKGFEAGLTFGSGVLGPDGTLTHSPIMDTDVYKRWAAYAQPGTDGGGWIDDPLTGIKWNPLTGEYQVYNSHAPKQAMFQAVASGQITAGQFASLTTSDLALNLLGSRVGAAAALHDPSYYFAGPLAPYGNLTDDERARFEAL